MPIPENHIGDIKLSNENSILYEIGTANYPRTTVEENEDDIIEQIEQMIKNLDGTSGIITFKKYERQLESIVAETAHYFGQRGSEMDVDNLVLLGTPYIPPHQIPYEYVLRFGEAPETTAIVRDENDSFIGYEDELLNEVLKIEVFDEVYHAIHRCRPFQHERQVFCYCRIPERVKSEMKYVKAGFHEVMSMLIPRIGKIRKYLAKFWPHMEVLDRLMACGGKCGRWKLHQKVIGLKAFEKRGWKQVVQDLLNLKIICEKKRKNKRGKIICITEKGKEWYHEKKKSGEEAGLW